eukprot:TRINITY_DN1246_c0_g1_i1.p1 TRINITY_DN1246_c0_g1~~TRINITY_DN1246_c0_g1_i1.p1  ORF type:complete len:290 (+),score=75.10 TRINITY_DN1246_c0_g1_i1:96-965(+)
MGCGAARQKRVDSFANQRSLPSNRGDEPEELNNSGAVRSGRSSRKGSDSAPARLKEASPTPPANQADADPPPTASDAQQPPPDRPPDPSAGADSPLPIAADPGGGASPRDATDPPNGTNADESTAQGGSFGAAAESSRTDSRPIVSPGPGDSTRARATGAALVPTPPRDSAKESQPRSEMSYLAMSPADVSKICRWVDDVVAARNQSLPLSDVWGEIDHDALRILGELEREKRQRAAERERLRRAQSDRASSIAQFTERSSVAGVDREHTEHSIDPSVSVSQSVKEAEG